MKMAKVAFPFPNRNAPTDEEEEDTSFAAASSVDIYYNCISVCVVSYHGMDVSSL